MNINYIKSVTNFITLIFDTIERANSCSNFLLKEGVIVRYLSSFGLPLCIRVTIGTEDENKFFIDKMKMYKRK